MGRREIRVEGDTLIEVAGDIALFAVKAGGSSHVIQKLILRCARGNESLDFGG
jgi:hypothetical protein